MTDKERLEQLTEEARREMAAFEMGFEAGRRSLDPDAPRGTAAAWAGLAIIVLVCFWLGFWAGAVLS